MTAKRIEVLINSKHETTIEPGQEKRVGTLESSKSLRFVAQDDEGKIVFDKVLTWDDLKAMGWSVKLSGS